MIRLKGTYEFWRGGELIDGRVIGGRLAYKIENIVCTPVYEYLLKSLVGESPGDVSASYFAFGDDDTPVTEADTTLGNELFRKAFTSKSWNGKQFVAICQLSTDEANFGIKEVGLFSGGSITADTGTLLSHALKPIEKNSNITYNVIYRLNLEEV